MVQYRSQAAKESFNAMQSGLLLIASTLEVWQEPPLPRFIDPHFHLF